MAYNILEISLDKYLIYHWNRNKNSARVLNMTGAEWELIWTKNYYQEKCGVLEKDLTVLKEKLDEM